MENKDYRLFLDDRRTPSSEWTLVRTVPDFRQILNDRGIPRCVSLDYDLEKTDPVHTGMDALEVLLDYLEKNTEAFATSNTPAIELSFHSSSDACRNSMSDATLQWFKQDERREEILTIQQNANDIQKSYWNRINP